MLKLKSKRLPVLISLAIGIFTSLIFIAFSSRFQNLELATIDWRFWIRGERDPGDEITIVTWDDETFKEMGYRYQDWSRSYHAKVIENLSRWGAKVIGFDIFVEDPSSNPGLQVLKELFTKEKDEKRKGMLEEIKALMMRMGEDKVLASACRQAGNVVFDSHFEIEEKKEYTRISFTPPLEIFLENKADYGFVNIRHDSDGFARTLLLTKTHQDETYLSSPLKILSKYLGVKESQIEVKEGKTKLGNIVIPIDKDNYMLINFRGGARTFRCVPYYQVYEGIAEPSFFKDKIVLVGMFTETIPLDIHPAPFTRVSGFRMPGIEVLANAIYTILHQDFLHPLGRRNNNLILLFLGLLTGILSYRLSFLKALLVSFLEMIIFATLVIFLFINQKMLLDLVCPLLVVLFTYGGVVLYRGLTEERKKKEIKSMFQRYVTQEVVNELIDNPEALALGGKRKEVTILFSDIRGFTSMSEKMKPEEVVHILNEYFSAMIEIIFKYEGTLDKFIGDAIMAVFGAPVAHPDDPQRALRTAVEMREELKKLQEKWKGEGRPAFDIGIGINTGEVVAGNIGSSERMDYTVIGDNVNLASRLESLNKEHQTHILISEDTYQKVKDVAKVRPIEPVKVKGKEKEVMIYEVEGLK